MAFARHALRLLSARIYEYMFNAPPFHAHAFTSRIYIRAFLIAFTLFNMRRSKFLHARRHLFLTFR